MRISRVQIENFRNFAKLDVALGENAVIVGENKIGKSNLLYALRLVLDPSLPDSARKLREEDFWDGLTRPLGEDDRITIAVDLSEFEETFEELLRFVNELDEEDSRAVREGLNEESLAIFDLLKKRDLDSADIKRIKVVAVGLLESLKAEKLRVDHWRDKEATRDAVRVTIRDFLWSDETGLPAENYTEGEVNAKAEEIFRHVYRAYPTVPSPYYVDVA